jgi:hypothetical protein
LEQNSDTEVGVKMAVEAKAKVRQRHAIAISQFRAWKDQNPNATHKQKFEMFDRLVDSARLDQLINAQTR